MNLDQLLKEIRNDEPANQDTEQAAARVRARLFPAAGDTVHASSTTIRGCADFTALIPAYMAGTLDDGRKLLFEAHTRECIACRKALERVRFGTTNIADFRPAKKRALPQYAGWAIAASALLAAAGAGWWGLHQYPALAGGPRATVASIDGALYKVDGATLTALAPGAELGEHDAVRTAKNSTAVLRLNDGSRIELNQRAEVSVTRNMTGSTVHLELGSIIVEAAKQREGTLQVVTTDCNVSVKGTIFSVNAGAKGSRVAVVEGTVWVDHGQKHDVLHRGEETSTASDMSSVPIRSEFEWSRNSAQYMSLLGEFSALKRDIAALPPAELRHESRLMAWLPADVQFVAAIPNIGGTVAEASQIFHDRLSKSDALTAWWNHVPAAQRSGFETTVRQLQTASAYLGNEIVIASYGKSSPVILAQIIKPGLDSFLKSQIPPEAYEGHMRFDNDLFVAASNVADLNRTAPAGDFLRSALYQKIAPLYQQGAGWLFGADLAQMGQFTTVADARFIVAESRTVAGVTENRASVTFSKPREGVASWLAAPGPMGSLDFISPDAPLAASMLLKSPALIVDDLTARMPVNEQAAIDLKSDMAGTFGGEVTIALDGPLLPVPSWKIAAEVYYPHRLQSAIAKYVAKFPELHLTQADADGRTFYTLKSDKLPWEADWTFVDGYWLAAASHELLVRSIQNRQTGYSLSKSNAFRTQLPHDSANDFSAIVYHNIGSVPGVVCFRAAPDRIDVAAMGNLLGMNLESLLSMSPNGIVGQVLSPARIAGLHNK